MPVVNPLARELVFKIVYYGPGLGGKTTTLQHIHASSKPEHRGKMVSLATPVDRTLYFDFLPIRVPNVRGMGVRLQLFTVPGQVYYNATRKLVLTGADGVVFVVDSQTARLDANLESLANLRDNLREHGRSLADVPHAVAYNKRDLDDLYAIEELEQRLNPHGAPSFATSATSGDGVFETLESITRAVLEDFERRMPETRGLPVQELELPEGGLADALRRADGDAAAVVPAVGGKPRGPTRRPSGVLNLSSSPPSGEEAARVLAEGARGPGHTHATNGSAAPQAGSLDLPLEHEGAARHFPESSTPGKAALETELDQGWGAAEEPPPLARAEQVATLAEAGATGVSFAPLWRGTEHRLVTDLEAALRQADNSEAVRLADQLVSRTLASAAGVLGSTPDAPRDPAVIALLLGMDGRRYFEFRSLVRDARAGVALGQSDALRAYVFAIDVRLSRMRMQGL